MSVNTYNFRRERKIKNHSLGFFESGRNLTSITYPGIAQGRTVM